jgi:hypothetical protein
MSIIYFRFLLYWYIIINIAFILDVNLPFKKFAYITLIICFIITELNIDYALAICSSNRGIGCLVSNIG